MSVSITVTSVEDSFKTLGPFYELLNLKNENL